jgi:hypothetical protein
LTLSALTFAAGSVFSSALQASVTLNVDCSLSGRLVGFALCDLINTLLGFVEKLYDDYGVRNFFLDEIHKYKNWNQELNLVLSFRESVLCQKDPWLHEHHSARFLSRCPR